MNALAAASTHTAGVLSTCFCISAVECFSVSAGRSFARASTHGSPFASGVSPIAPAVADPKNPACHPASDTIDPTNRNEKNSPRLWLAEKNP